MRSLALIVSLLISFNSFSSSNLSCVLLELDCQSSGERYCGDYYSVVDQNGKNLNELSPMEACFAVKNSFPAGDYTCLELPYSCQSSGETHCEGGFDLKNNLTGEYFFFSEFKNWKGSKVCENFL